MVSRQTDKIAFLVPQKTEDPMTREFTPATLLESLVQRFEPTGIALLGAKDARSFLDTGKGPSFKKWSTYFQRLYRYHDFCALGLSELTAEGGKGAEHLLVELKKHKALAGAYRLADMAVVAANPDLEKGLPNPAVLDDEIAAISGALRILFWAFATLDERKQILQALPNPIEEQDRAQLLEASPNQCLAPLSEAGALIEDLAEDPQSRPIRFGRAFYPPLHPAAEMDRPCTDDEMAFLISFI